MTKSQADEISKVMSKFFLGQFAVPKPRSLTDKIARYSDTEIEVNKLLSENK